MKHFILIILSISFLNLSAQIKTRYTNGSIYYLNGDIYDCKIGFPINNKSSKLGPTIRSKNKLAVKSLGDEKQKIENDDIDFIVFEGEQGYFKLKWAHKINYKGRKYKEKVSKHKSWFLLEGGCEELIAYSWADRYEMDKKGRIISKYIGQLGFFGSYYLIRPGEANPTFICSMTEGNGIGFKKFHKNVFQAYFREDEHAGAFLKGKKKLKVQEIKDYVENRCSNK